MTRKEALEYINNMWMSGETHDALEVLIPEFGESEDERIRRTLVEYFGPKAQLDFVRGVPIQKIRDWLEKQKDLDKMIVVSPEVWDKAINDAYENGKKDNENQKENPKSADSIPSDAKCGDRDSNYGVFPEDVIVVARACEKLKAHGYTELAHALKNVNLYTKEQKPVDYDHEMWKNCEANFEGGKKEVIEHPEKYGLTKQKPVDLSEMLVHKEPYIAPVPTPMVADEQKQEWSEEDERVLKGIIGLVDHDQHYGVSNKEMISWLKSLRNRPKSSDTWKPSEEQMAALEAATVRYQSTGLESLYEDLKKL